MSNLSEHEVEQEVITAICASGKCDHPECQTPGAEPDNPVYLFVREFSESSEFPTVRTFADPNNCRKAMLNEVIQLAFKTKGTATSEMDGEPLSLLDLAREEYNALNVQWEGGAVDCFRFFENELEDSP